MPTLRLRSGQALSQRPRKMEHPVSLIPGVRAPAVLGVQSFKSKSRASDRNVRPTQTQLKSHDIVDSSTLLYVFCELFRNSCGAAGFLLLERKHARRPPTRARPKQRGRYGLFLQLAHPPVPLISFSFVGRMHVFQPRRPRGRGVWSCQ